jgi:hypothetical protein
MGTHSRQIRDLDQAFVLEGVETSRGSDFAVLGSPCSLHGEIAVRVLPRAPQVRHAIRPSPTPAIGSIRVRDSPVRPR